MGEEGFSSDSSLLYHRGMPSAIVDARAVGAARPDADAQRAAGAAAPEAARPVPRRGAQGHRRGHRPAAGAGQRRRPHLLRRRPSLTSPYYRNATGDECVYVERGTATVETVFGALEVGQGDYVIIPRATTHRWVPTGTEPLRTYAIEANSHIAPPKRYLSEVRPVPRARAVLRARPARARPSRCSSRAPTSRSTSSTAAPAPAGSTGTVHVVPEHPFDVVGWDGCLYPYAFNIADFEPITGRVHQPPPVHQVFEGHNFVICNFVPRKVDYHPLAVPVPYYHSNVDSDEVMFYVDGDYEARKGSGIGKGSISLHPGGHSTARSPARSSASLGAEYFDELAVMVDTFRPARPRRGRPRRRRRQVRLVLVGPGAVAHDHPLRRALRRRGAVPARRRPDGRRRARAPGRCAQRLGGWSARSWCRPAGWTS